MDIITTTNTPSSATPKSPEPDTETPTRIQQPTTTNTKPLSNGVLKRHHPHHHQLANPATVAAVTYKECLKNHAASLGGHALDGCGEFMPSPTATAGDPSSIKCAACGCHRNFHRREPEEPPPISATTATTHVIEYQSHHRHHPPPPPPLPPFQNRSPNSASPPPISSSYYPSAPHMLLALSGAGLSIPPESTAAPTNLASPSANHQHRKRFRTKFTQGQKEKMQRFAERVGWKMQKRDEDLVQEFCHEVGVDRGVLKVWMHNNKNTFGKRDHGNANEVNGSVHNNNNNNNNNNVNNSDVNGNDDDDDNNLGGNQDPNQYENDSGVNVGTNGSSSSS